MAQIHISKDPSKHTTVIYDPRLVSKVIIIPGRHRYFMENFFEIITGWSL